MKPLHTLVIGALLTVFSHSYAADSWPQMRGPTALGVSAAKGLPLTWSETEHVAWKTAIAGEGWSSPVVGDGAVYVTSALDDGRSLHAYRIDLASGKIVWDVTVFTNEVVPVKHARNSHASPTPVLAGDRLYVHFGTMGTACLAVKDGKTLWANRELKVDHAVGAGGSPVLYRDKLLLSCDGVDAQYGVALDAKTGKIAWKKDRSAIERLAKVKDESRKCFSTPLVVTVGGVSGGVSGGVDQAIVNGAERLYAQDPLTGEDLWHVDFTGYSNATMAVSDGKMLVFNTAFNTSSLWGVRLDGAKGDVTASHVVWKVKFPSLSQSSPILLDGRVYVVNDSGILLCLDLATGKEIYKERLGADFAASPVLADGRMYFFDARGKATVVEPGATFKILATNTLADGCMASPAVVGKALIVRTKTSLYRIE
ncbi:MAG: PQQ-binding-like beta-propeller repeat protein [Planctomycetes bacterium]|nr:PQQ-binding-like beta-propeller repeat protein [Planctomycetota bacterium]